jgi:hypothetical protein
MTTLNEKQAKQLDLLIANIAAENNVSIISVIDAIIKILLQAKGIN